MNVSSDEAGTWCYLVDCATCNEPIAFKQAPSPDDEPIVQLPAMSVRCPRCHKDHIYAADLILRRHVSDACR
jgi:hypothetical protein